MKFLTNWTIDLGKLRQEKYTAFNGDFEMQLDYGVLKLMSDSEYIDDDQEADMKTLLMNVDKKTGKLKTKHDQAYGIGRYYANHKISPINVSRIIKHTLFTYLDWIDIDMVKGHPTIIKQIALKNNYATPEIDKYLANPDATFKTLIEHYATDDKLTEDDVKDIFNLAIYGGGHSTWLRQMACVDKNGKVLEKKKKNIKIVNQQEHPIVKAFIKEVRAISSLVYKSNQALSVCVASPCNYDCSCYPSCSLSEYEKQSRVMSYWCGAIENHIVHLTAKLLIKEKWLVPKSFGQELDGFCFKNPCVDADEKAMMTQKINDMILEKTRLAVTMKFKEYKTDKICLPILEARTMWKLEDEKPVVSESDNDEDEINYTKAVENDDDAVNIIYAAVINKLKYCNGILYFKSGGIWITDEKQIKSGMNVFVSKFGLVKYLLEKFVSYTNKRSSWINISNGVIDYVMSKSDDEWYDKNYSSSLGYILFNNGYWDWKNCCFHENSSETFDDSIVFMEKISYDLNHTLSLEDDDELDYINSVQKRLFTDPFGDEVGSYYCQVIARGLAGDAQKNFVFGVGDSNTGKSILGSVCENSCGGYFGSFNGSNLKYKAIENADEAQALRWLMLLKNKRIVISSELPMGFPIDGNKLKKMSNGGLDAITARVHGGNETKFLFTALPILFANDIDNIEPCDSAVKSRLICINYDKVFVDEPTNQFHLKKDPNLNEEIRTLRFKNAFIWCLINAYKNFHVTNKRVANPPVAEMAIAFNDIVGENGDDLITKFQKDYEITNNVGDYVRSSEIAEWLKGSKVSIKKFSVEIKKYSIVNNLENVISVQKKIGKNIQVWKGIKVLTESNVEDGGEE